MITTLIFGIIGAFIGGYLWYKQFRGPQGIDSDETASMTLVGSMLGLLGGFLFGIVVAAFTPSSTVKVEKTIEFNEDMAQKIQENDEFIIKQSKNPRIVKKFHRQDDSFINYFSIPVSREKHIIYFPKMSKNQ